MYTLPRFWKLQRESHCVSDTHIEASSPVASASGKQLPKSG